MTGFFSPEVQEEQTFDIFFGMKIANNLIENESGESRDRNETGRPTNTDGIVPQYAFIVDIDEPTTREE